MEVSCDKALIDYMAKKGYTAIELGVAQANTCCSGFADIYTGFLTEKGEERLKGKVYGRIHSPAGDLVVTDKSLEFDDEIHLGLRSFLGLKDITISGIRAFS